MTIKVTHSKVSTIPDGDDTSVVRPSDWNDDHVLVGLGTMAEQNANNVNITGGSISGVTVSGYIPTSAEGVANGVATLDSNGQVPLSQIPALGDLNYQGTWNASTNTPTLTSSVGTKGYYYVVSVAGTTNLNGITDWQIGDWAVYNGTAWQKIDNTDAVTSVNGKTGTVVLTYSDVGAFPATTTTGTGNVVLATNPTISSPNIDVIDFDQTYSTALTAGQLGWDGNNTLAIGMAGGNVVQHIGEDLYFYFKATSAVTKGQVVMFTGAVGASGVPTGAPATGITDGTYIMGIAAESVALNGFGLVQAFGELRNVNTSGYADGDILWYDPAVTGGLTKTKPSAPNVKVQMAAVINGGSSGGGTILIRIDAGSTLGGTDSNAQITNPTNGQILTYDGGNGYWKNTELTAGTAISVSKSANGVLTVANTAPDQTVSLTGGTGISTSGTYPNFTITNTAPSSGGTVTSITAGTGLSGGTITTSGTIALANTTVSAGSYTNSSITVDAQGRLTSASSGTAPVTSVGVTAPLASTGGTAPTLSIPAATSSVNGYLTSADWSTFNGKAPSFTYTTGYIPFGQGTTTPNQSANLFWDNTNIRLGIKTANPQRALHAVGVDGAVASFPTIGAKVVGVFENNGNSNIALVNSGAGAVSGINAYISGSTSAYADVVFANNSGTPYTYFTNLGTEISRINANGLGIGTAAASTYRLDILDATAKVRIKSSTGTNSVLQLLTNTGGGVYLGAESSTGGSLFTGTGAYAAVFGTVGAYPVAFATNNAQAMQISSTGGVSIGNTTDPGATNLSVSGTTNTASGNTSAANATATTIYTMPTLAQGLYIVQAALGNNNPATFTAVSLVTQGNGSSRATALAVATNMVITVSGLNIQATQTAGGTVTVTWTVFRIA